MIQNGEVELASRSNPNYGAIGNGIGNQTEREGTATVESSEETQNQEQSLV